MTPHEGEIGRYRIVRRIGVGGMAWTFLCTLEGIGGFQKYVVIKMLDPERANDPRYIDMFLDEARLWAKFNHPSIPQAFEISTVNNIPYTVLEYVPGPTLHLLARKLTTRSNLDYYRIARIGSDIARALDYAYYGISSDGTQLKVIHRDVTLNNILLSTTGRPSLIDFGIALAEERLAHTEVGTFKGRIQYMAPEQLLEQPLDHRTDLFQLGVTLYRLATGQPAYSGENKSASAQWKMRMEKGAPPISTITPDCPPLVAALIEQCIQPEIDARPERGSKLADALDAAIAAGSPRPVDAADLAEWVQMLFPNQEWISTNPGTGTTQGQLPSFSGGVTGSGPFGTGGTPIGSMPQPTSRGQIAIFATLLGGLGISVLLVVVLSVLLVATQVFRGDTPSDPSADPNRAAVVYLDEVDRLIAVGRYRDAGVFLLKARGVNPTDPELVVRLSRASSAVQDKLLIAAAEQALAADDLDTAAERAREMLDLEPTNAEALAVLARVSEARERSAKPADPAAPSGKLRVASSPSGRVFIDDKPYGATPLADLALPPGQHTVYVRLAGYAPLKRSVTIKSDEVLALDLVLEPISTETKEKSDERLSSLVAAVATAEPELLPEPAPGTADPTDILPELVPTEPGAAEPAPVVPEAQPADLSGDPPGVADPGVAPAPAPTAPAPAPQGTAEALSSDVPMPKQALILARALSFDSQLEGRVGSKLVIASLYTDANTKKRALRMNVELSNTGMQVQGKAISTTSAEFTTAAALAEAISAQGIDVLYIPTGMDAQLSQIMKVAREANVLTIGAEPGYVKSGLSLGVFNRAGNTVIGLNQGAASAEGAQFAGELLQLAVPLN